MPCGHHGVARESIAITDMTAGADLRPHARSLERGKTPGEIFGVGDGWRLMVRR